MDKFHEVCGSAVELSQDRTTGRATSFGRSFLFSDRPFTQGQTFSVRLTNPSSLELGDDLPVHVGATTVDPATRSCLPDQACDLTGSCVLTPRGDLYKDGERTEWRSDLMLVNRDPTVITLTLTSQGSVTLTQDGVSLGDLCTGVTHPVWAVVEPWSCTSVTVFRQDRYTMSAIPRGFAVIININKVKGYAERKRSEKDVDRLTALFGNLYFEVKSHTDLDATAILDTLQGISQRPELRLHNCLIVVLMSHGGEGYILGTDRRRVAIEHAIHLFSDKDCSGLIGKPKLFFIQACNGRMTDVGVATDRAELPNDEHKPSDLPERVPTGTDILLAKASIKGYVSYRRVAEGTHFIHALANVIKEHKGDLDIGRMMTRVVDAVHRMGIDEKQCPTYKSTLTKDLYFNP